MKKSMFTAVFVLLFFLPALAQTPAAKPGSPQAQPKPKPSPLIPYAGNWIGSFENKPWLILNLSLHGEQFSGSIQRLQKLEFNDNGELKKVGEEFTTETVVEGMLNPDGLLLTFSNPETKETDRYMMKLTGDTTAEVKMLAMSMPPGMPKLKPWKLTKYAAAVGKQP
jgi:hypothetical protein